MMYGSLVGALLELAQTGFKIVANNFSVWFTARRSLVGFGAGFSPAMIGAVIGWLIGIPIISEVFPQQMDGISASEAVMQLFSNKVRYIGIGAMFVAGVWTLLTLVKPFYISLKLAFSGLKQKRIRRRSVRTEIDIPIHIVVSGIFFVLFLHYFLFQSILPLTHLIGPDSHSFYFLLTCLSYVLVLGFIVSAITAYFSGLVGVTATPGSAIVIIAFLVAAFTLDSHITMNQFFGNKMASISDAIAVTIILGAVITGAAAISNDNMQDLKVGHLLGATPWKQQLMLMLGVVSAALIIPVVMESLFKVYGIAGVFPRDGMDPSQMLAAPPAAMLASVTQAVFRHDLPWDMILVGNVIALIAIFVNMFLQKRGLKFSVLGLAMGIYLDLSASTPIFLGGLIAYLAKKGQRKLISFKPHEKEMKRQHGTILACGLVAGAALMDVALAIPLSIMHSPDALRIFPENWGAIATMLAILSVLLLAKWFFRVVCDSKVL